MSRFVVIVSLAITFSIVGGCSKDPGEGGQATIVGNIQVQVINANYLVLQEYDAQEYDVYIQYGGEGDIYHDRVETSFNGNFKFEFLRKGKYKVVVFEECPEYPGCSNYQEFDLEILDKKEVYTLDTIYVYKV